MQLPVAAKLTAKPEEADAETLKSASPYVLLPSAPKVIVCEALFTVSAAVLVLLV